MSVTTQQLRRRYRGGEGGPGGPTWGFDSPSHRTVERLLDSFFRRPVLCLLPFVLFTALGLQSAADFEQRYESSGVMGVSNRTLLANLAGVSEDAFSWETPAQITSRSINELLGTDAFTATVASGAGLGPALEEGAVTHAEVRSAVGAVPIGTSLVQIKASTLEPQVAMRLVGSVIESFRQSVIEADSGQSTAATEFFDQLVQTYQGEVQAARAALEQHLIGPGGDDDATAVDRTERARLDADLDLATERYADAVKNSEDARLANQQAQADINQRLRVVDPPELPGSPESVLKAQVLRVGMFAMAGLLLSLALVGLRAVLDHSIRSVGDVRARLGKPLLAVVPDAGR
jgi:uncharacterized protein involved in exopolysaccharide biosynthesis